MEDAYIITGGKKLKGEIKLSGAKNVALKIIIAALLFDSKVTLEHVPQINDVFELLHLIKELGAKAHFIDTNTLEIDPFGLKNNQVDLLHASKTRVSFMLFAPLLYRFQSCFIPNPGGCRLGARSIDRIVSAMIELGVIVNYHPETGYYEAIMKKKPSGKYRFEKTTHTGTELLIMLSIFCKDDVIIENAALEPEIDELITFLNQGGAKIEKNGSTITIYSATKLIQKEPFYLVSDRNEAVTFSILSIATGGEAIVHGVQSSMMQTFLDTIEKANCGVEYKGDNSIRFFYQGQIRPVSVETAPHPGFMTDWQPNWAVLMTLAHGKSIIHERLFENRFAYVAELQRLGADIRFVDTEIKNPEEFYLFNYEKGKKYHQSIEVTGGQKLHNGVLSISDLRAGATLAIAALVAEGQSVVNGASIMERGYENFEKKVQSLGGDIIKV